MKTKYSNAQEIIDFYLKPSTAKETANAFGISLYFLNKILQEHNINKHSSEIMNRLAREAAQKVLLEKYGVASPFALSSVQSKVKQTIQEKYGVDNPAKNQQVKEKTKQTCQEKYGGNGPMSSKEVRAKSEKTCLEKYGTTIATKSEIVQNKIKETDLEKYGTEYHILAESVKNKIKQTNLERFGQEYQIGSEQTKNKIKETNLKRYGVEHNSQTDKFKAKMSTHWADSNYKNKVEQTILSKYGVTNYMQTDEYKQLMSSLNADKDYQQKRLANINKAKLANGTFNTSQVEENFYKSLATKIELSDIKRQYRDTRYPFACDFYIKSEDLFIELNFSWTHGGKLFENTDKDKEKLAIWQEKAKTSNFYKNAIETWTIRDIKKYNIAKKYNLNYLVFYTEAEALAWLNKKINNIV